MSSLSIGFMLVEELLDQKIKEGIDCSIDPFLAGLIRRYYQPNRISDIYDGLFPKNNLSHTYKFKNYEIIADERYITINNFKHP